MKQCPYCSEMIADTAKKCRYCGEWIEAQPLETAEVLESRSESTATNRVVLNTAENYPLQQQPVQTIAQPHIQTAMQSQPMQQTEQPQMVVPQVIIQNKVEQHSHQEVHTDVSDGDSSIGWLWLEAIGVAIGVWVATK